MRELGIETEMYMVDWLLTIFSKSLPLDIAMRVWDSYFCRGELFLYETALALLKMLGPQLQGPSRGPLLVCMRVWGVRVRARTLVRVRACVRACVRARVRTCARARVCVCVTVLPCPHAPQA